MPKASITVFRVGLFVSLVVITFLAVTPLEYTPVAGVNDKISHIAAFFVLALLADFSFPDTKLNHTKILFLLFYGLSIEFIQYFIPYREFSFLDLIADAGGIISYGLSMPVLKLIPLFQFRWDLNKKI